MPWCLCVFGIHIGARVCKCVYLWLRAVCLQVCVVCLRHMYLSVHLFVSLVVNMNIQGASVGSYLWCVQAGV